MYPIFGGCDVSTDEFNLSLLVIVILQYNSLLHIIIVMYTTMLRVERGALQGVVLPTSKH